MSDKLKNALVDQKQQTEQYNQKISGMLGITINGARTVEVANRNSYVYVRLRNSQNELIQAFNNRVAPSYNLPVIVERQGNRYVVLDVDTKRYDNNWGSFSPYLPRHGNTHSFDIESGGGGDIVWVYPRQFMPLLAIPSGSVGSPNVIISPYTLKKENGTWMYVGNTGTASFTPYNPAGSGSVMGLIVLDTTSGNPYLLINSGSVFFGVTGSSQVYPYIPTLTNPAHIPIAAVRLVSGTSRLTWDNIYDVRQFVHGHATGSSGGLSSVSVQDEGAAQGSVTAFNFVGQSVDVTVSGSVARVFVTGSSGGLSSVPVQDEGTPQGDATTFNFVGPGVDATISGSVVQVNVPGVSGTSSFSGNPMSAVLTSVSGTLFTPAWLKWQQDGGQKYLDFGADEVKVANAGWVGYNKSQEQFEVFGGGTGTPRKVKLFEDLYVDNNLYVGGGQQIIAANQVTNGDSHDHLGGDGGPVDHTSLNNIGTNTHPQIDTHIASGTPAHYYTNIIGALAQDPGTYTPLLTGTANVDTLAVTAPFMYIRIGNFVTVAGALTVDPTAAANTTVGISLPIASDFTANPNCVGNGTSQANNCVSNIIADISDNRATMTFQAPVTTNMVWRIVFVYEIK